jgi:hypothetical protein
MSTAQLSGRSSLRDIETTIASQRHALRQYGARQTARRR